MMVEEQVDILKRRVTLIYIYRVYIYKVVQGHLLAHVDGSGSLSSSYRTADSCL